MNIIEFPEPNAGMDSLIQAIFNNPISENTKNDDAVDELFDEIESLFYAVSTNQLSAAEASSILIGRLAGALILNDENA